MRVPLRPADGCDAGNTYCDHPTWDLPPELDGTVITSMATASKHSCAITSSGNLRCWAISKWDNEFGQADVPGDVGTVTSVAVGYTHTCLIETSGRLRCFGSNYYGQTDARVPFWLGTVTSVAAGERNTCASGPRTGGRLVCWGGNDGGQNDVPANLGAIT
jgi:alpha-tubulin suppressor-like RCC1 family protein